MSWRPIQRFGMLVLRQLESEEVAGKLDGYPDDPDNPDEPSGLREIQEQFLYKFEQRTKTYVIAALLVGISVFSFDWLLCGRIPDQLLGLSIDVLGALILARGLLNGPYTILASRGLDSGGQIKQAMIEDSVDGFYGVLFLVVGILGQALSAFGIAVPVSYCAL